MTHDPHALTLATDLALVSEPAPDPVRRPRSEIEARVLLAQLVGAASARVPAPLVARALDRGQSTVYGWTAPGCVGGLRAVDLALAPQSWASTVLRGLLAQAEAPRCGTLSRLELCRLLTSAAALIASGPEVPESLPTEALERRLGEIDRTAEALEAERQRTHSALLEARRREDAQRRASR